MRISFIEYLALIKKGLRRLWLPFFYFIPILCFLDLVQQLTHILCFLGVAKQIPFAFIWVSDTGRIADDDVEAGRRYARAFGFAGARCYRFRGGGG